MDMTVQWNGFVTIFWMLRGWRLLVNIYIVLTSLLAITNNQS